MFWQCFFKTLTMPGPPLLPITTLKSFTGGTPKVVPANKTHILISWENVFEDCDDTTVKRVEVHIKTRKGGLEKITTNVKFSKKEVHLDRSPCFQHQVKVLLEPKHPSDIPQSSLLAVYNEMGPNEREYNYFKTFYSGLLNKEVVQKTCLKRNDNSVTIPDTPEPLKNCIELMKKTGRAELGKSMRLSLTVVNPEEDGIIEIDATVDQLNHCLGENSENQTVENVTEEPCLGEKGGCLEENQEEEKEEKGDAEEDTGETFSIRNILIASGTVVALVIVLFPVVKALIWLKRRHDFRREFKQDVHNEYEANADYYAGEVTAEVVDANPYYGGEVDNWEGSTVTDRNVYYE